MDKGKSKKRNLKKGRRSSLIKVIIVIVAIAVIVALIGTVKIALSNENEAEIITSSQLEKIINISELSTYQAVYNGIAKKENEDDKNEIDYYVSYESKVNAGLDIDKIKIDVDNDTKRIIVTLPEIKITDVNVDITTLDYIFMDDSANTNTVSEEAYKLCINDVKNEIATEDAIYDLAKQNAKNIVSALLNPFVEQLDSEYVIAIN